MQEYELKSRLGALIRASIGKNGDSISQARNENLRRYHAQPYGDEKAGRSQVITTECRDTIMWLLPSIMKVFLSTDKIVEFLPTTPEKEEQAQQQTDFINYIVMQENDSFTIFHNWFLDALQCKNGYVKYGYDEVISKKIENYTGIDEMSLIKISENDELEILEVEENNEILEGVVKVTSYDVKVIHSKKSGKYYIENIPPERVLVDSRATSMEDTPFIGIVYYKSRSDLIQMGYDEYTVSTLPTTNSISNIYEATTRDSVNGTLDNFNNELVEIIECYAKIDYDGDGIDELHRFIVCGENAGFILSDEIVDDIPIVSIAPFLKPHSFFGDSMVDYTKDIQRINTTLWRQILDYIYLANNPMWEVEENSITNMNDALKRTPGGLVRTRRSGSITPIATTPLQSEVFYLLDRLKDMKDRRTGVMEINQGLDPNAINKTATGTLAIMDAGRQMQDLIVRVFAETGVKKLFKGLYSLVLKHQDIIKTIRLRNKWVSIDPSQWDENVDVVINVGLGTGSSQVKLAQLEKILAHQKNLMNTGMVTPQQLYNTLSKIILVSGYKDVDSFMINPATQPKKQPTKTKPSVEELALAQTQAEREKAKLDAKVKIFNTETNAKVELIKNKTNYELKLLEFDAKYDKNKDKNENV